MLERKVQGCKNENIFTKYTLKGTVTFDIVFNTSVSTKSLKVK